MTRLPPPRPACATLLEGFARVALSHAEREYPSKLDHVINGPEDLSSPRGLHPAFFGSFDWHSSVHAHWLLVRALLLAPDMACAAEARRVLDTHLAPGPIAGELAYLRRPNRGTFERTYGWAWLLKLAAELEIGAQGSRPGKEACRRWLTALEPLAWAFTDRYLEYLPKATYPIRTGTHQSSAFGVALALDYAGRAGIGALLMALEAAAERWFGGDEACQAWEPGGTDFLSPALMEAACMARVLGPRFPAWLDRFLPRLAERAPRALFVPATVSDRTDGQIAHLDGLNLSRAWCMRVVAGSLPEGDPRRAVLLDSAAEHLETALPHVTGDYMGEHWLATYALLAMTEAVPDPA